LYLIIDYGSAYVNGMPVGSASVVGDRDRRLGMTSTIANEIADIYTVFYSFFMSSILLVKPYLLISSGALIRNKLTGLLYKYLESYGFLFTISTQDIMNNLLLISSNPARGRKYDEYFLSIIKPVFRLASPMYISPSFQKENIPPDFRGSMAVMLWMRNNFYLDTKIEENTYVFNWGYVPTGIIEGIQPNKEIEEMISSKNSYVKNKIVQIKDFMKKI
jgi:hypothetical protein